MSRYLIRRVLRGLLTIFISVSLTFFIVRAMPSDPVSLMVSPVVIEGVDPVPVTLVSVAVPICVATTFSVCGFVMSANVMP